jgi:hypothetical protein
MEGILNRALEAAYRMGQRGSLSFEWDELWNYYEDLEERVKDAEDDEDIEGGIESGWFDN